MAKKGKRKNVHFRQSAKSFKAQKQTQIYSYINRSLPYRIYKVGKKVFRKRVRNAKEKIGKSTLDLLKKRSNKDV